LYGVLGLTDGLDEIIDPDFLPVAVKAVLLPFKGQIIYDGLFNTYSVSFGSGIRGDLNQTYQRVKQTEGITEGWVELEGQLQPKTSIDRRAPKKPAPDWRSAIAEFVQQTDKMSTADTARQSAALGVLRAAASFAQAAFQLPDENEDYLKQLKTLRRAMTRLENILEEEQYDYY
jgi:hypothetical protein